MALDFGSGSQGLGLGLDKKSELSARLRLTSTWRFSDIELLTPAKLPSLCLGMIYKLNLNSASVLRNTNTRTFYPLFKVQSYFNWSSQKLILDLGQCKKFELILRSNENILHSVCFIAGLKS